MQTALSRPIASKRQQASQGLCQHRGEFLGFGQIPTKDSLNPTFRRGPDRVQLARLIKTKRWPAQGGMATIPNAPYPPDHHRAKTLS
jgi:hypothetical protein